MKVSSINLKALVNLLDNVSKDDIEIRNVHLLDSGGPSSWTPGKKNSPKIKNNLDELKSVIGRMDNIQAKMEKMLGFWIWMLREI